MSHLWHNVLSLLGHASFMSIAEDYQSKFPQAAEVIRTTFYVDNRLTGASTVQEAITIHENLNQLLNKVCMTLRKWRASSPEILPTIPEEIQEEKVQLIVAPEQCIRLWELTGTLTEIFLHITTPLLQQNKILQNVNSHPT